MKKNIPTILLLASTLLSGCNSGTSSSGMKESNDSTTFNRLSGVYVASSAVDENVPLAITKCKVYWTYVYAGYTYVTFKNVGGCKMSSVRFTAPWKDRAAQNMLFAYRWNYWVYFSHSGTRVISYAI